jgi:hypothetical protein
MAYADIDRSPVVVFYNRRVLKGDSRLLPMSQHPLKGDLDFDLCSVIRKVGISVVVGSYSVPRWLNLFLPGHKGRDTTLGSTTKLCCLSCSQLDHPRLHFRVP